MFYDQRREGDQVEVFDFSGPQDPILEKYLDHESVAQVREELELIEGALPPFDVQEFLDGKISQYARSGFRDTPTQGWQEQWQVLRLGVLSPRASAF